MTESNPFETRVAEYDAWFDAHPASFESELRAIRAVLPDRHGRWVEIGVGTGQFASRLGIGLGIEPAAAMIERARKRGVLAVRGVAEHLPLPEASVDAMFYITTLCFVSDVDRCLAEAHRVLRRAGHLVAAILPRDSKLGLRIAADSFDPFLRRAKLLTVSELRLAVARAGFRIDREVETLTNVSAAERIEEPHEGSAHGSFVVVRGVRVDGPEGSSRQS